MVSRIIYRRVLESGDCSGSISEQRRWWHRFYTSWWILKLKAQVGSIESCDQQGLSPETYFCRLALSIESPLVFLKAGVKDEFLIFSLLVCFCFALW